MVTGARGRGGRGLGKGTEERRGENEGRELKRNREQEVNSEEGRDEQKSTQWERGIRRGKWNLGIPLG